MYPFGVLESACLFRLTSSNLKLNEIFSYSENPIFFNLSSQLISKGESSFDKSINFKLRKAGKIFYRTDIWSIVFLKIWLESLIYLLLWIFIKVV